LGDVSIVSPTNGQVLVYNSSTSKWENSSGGFVPYTGAVTTVDLGAQGLRAGYIRFDTSVVSVPDEQGIMYWDADNETVDVILNGTIMQIGQDLFYPVKNQTGSTIPKGTAVRFAGTVGASGRLLIAPFIANNTVPSSRFMGVTSEAILDGADGKVMWFGRIRGINTNSFNEGDILYASTTTAGAFQTTIPVAPNNIVQVAAVVTKSINQGAIFVRPTIGSNINKDEGVKITSVADKDLLQYQSGTALWENKTLAQVIGSAYVPSTRTITINGTTQDLSADRTYSVGTVTSVAALTLGTTGTDLTSTVANGTTTPVITLNVPTASATNRGALSSTDWTTFNNKQNALTNPVTGTGTTNYLPKFTGASTIGNSQVVDDGTNVGIGNTGAAYKLEVFGNAGINTSGNALLAVFGANNNTDKYFRIRNSDGVLELGTSSTEHYLLGFGSIPLRFYTNGTVKTIITSGGNLLVGTTTDSGYKLDVNGTGRFSSSVTAVDSTDNNLYAALIHKNVTGGANSGLRVHTNGTDAGASAYAFRVTSGNTVGSPTNTIINALVNGNVGIGTNSPDAALTVKSIEAAAKGISIFGRSDNIGTLRFFNSTGATEQGGLVSTSTYLGFSYSDTERMRITSGGNVLIGTTTDDSKKLRVNGTISSLAQDAFFLSNLGNGTDTKNWSIQNLDTSGQFRIRAGNDAQTDGINAIVISRTGISSVSISISGAATFTSLGTGTVYSNGGTLTNTNPSDLNLKTNIAPINYGLEEILKLNPVTFDWKNDTINQGKQYGFIAQEVQKIMPDLVKQGEYLGLDKEAIFTTLVKAIQELKQEIDTLKN
jgi:hypothetical protein